MIKLLEKILKIPTIIQPIDRKERKYAPLDAVIYEINAELSRLVEPALSVEVWIDGDMTCFNTTWHSYPTNWTPGEYKLFTHPQAKPVLLSYEKIDELTEFAETSDFYSLIRIIEQEILSKNGFVGVE